MFSKIIPAFTSQNISALGTASPRLIYLPRFKSRLFPGPLVLVALLYEGIGMILAWMISQIFWVPHRFR